MKRDTPPRSWKGIHLHVHNLLVVEGIHPQVHTLLVVEGIHPHVHNLLVVEGIHPQVHTLLVVEGINPHVHTLLVAETAMPSRSHRAVDGKGYTLTFTTCWWWKGYTLKFTTCWWWKRIHPHVHNLLVVETDTPSRSHPAVDGKDTPSRSQPAGAWCKGYTLKFAPCWWRKRTFLTLYTQMLKLRNAGKKLDQHRHFHWYSSESVRCRYSGIRVTLLPLVKD